MTEPVSFIVPGDPIPQPRPRVYANGGVGKDPRVTRQKQATVMAARRARVQALTGPVAVSLRYYRATARRCDWDNLAKLTCDALNGVAWGDDSQIAHAQVTVSVDRERPRTEVRIEALGPAFVNEWDEAHQGPA